MSDKFTTGYPGRDATPLPEARGMEHFPGDSPIYVDHPSHAKPGIHVFPDRLHVFTVVENPLRWRSRYWNYWSFERMVKSAGAILYTIEVAFGDRAFEVTESGNPQHLQLRTTDELLHKENALNLGVEKMLPTYAKKIAWLDADVQFQRPDWAQETLHLLEHYKVLQMFSHAMDLGPNSEPLDINEGFVMHELINTFPGLPDNVPLRESEGKPNSWFSPYLGVGYGAKGKLRHPGLVWAWRREAYNGVGGLMDWVMGGSADHYMALALFNLISPKPEGQVGYRYLNLHQFTNSYSTMVLEWQHRAEHVIRRNVGFMPGLVTHFWHGPKQKRQYLKRADLLAKLDFDPLHDLKRDSQGLWQLHDDGTPRFIKLRDGLRGFARLRDEDSNEAQRWHI